jgi:hypothetical protein
LPAKAHKFDNALWHKIHSHRKLIVRSDPLENYNNMKTCILALAFVLAGGVYAQVNPCIICPNGATAGDDYAPLADLGNPTTCAELIDAAKLKETGSEYCAVAEMGELSCCYTAPENPCTICPNGATAGDDYVPPYEGNTYTCAELIDYATQFETESDYCGVFGESDESYCCYTEPENPCVICPNGANAGDDFVPEYEGSLNMTCVEIINEATIVETGSDYCRLVGELESYCCPPVNTTATNPCIICPNGATAGDDYVVQYGGSVFTCAEVIESAKLSFGRPLFSGSVSFLLQEFVLW